ncbi:unnamed protein product, partial [marine sediment metagenome]
MVLDTGYTAPASDDINLVLSDSGAVPQPVIGISLVTPDDDDNHTTGEFKEYTTEVCCLVSDCGEINVSLDPLPSVSNQPMNFPIEESLGLKIVKQDGFEKDINIRIGKINKSRFAIYYNFNQEKLSKVEDYKDGKITEKELETYFNDVDKDSLSTSITNFDKYPASSSPMIKLTTNTL